MFNKEESRKLREDFWISFGKSFPRKWILYDTQLKGFAFKFHFDTKSALVTLDLEDDIEHRIKFWDKLQSLKTILVDEYLPEVIFEEEYFLDNGKEISRIYIPLNQKVSIHNKNTWRAVMEFFNEKMAQFEDFFQDYKDFIDA